MQYDGPAFRGRRRKQLPDEVAGYVREQIMAGDLRPGEFLRMDPLAEAVGVSITPVREGLLTLSSEGFVTAVPRRGFMVAAFTREDIRDLFWAQSRLAGELAARAAERISDSDLDRLADLTERCREATRRGDLDETGHLAHQFHRTINLAAESGRLTRLLSAIIKHLPRSFYDSVESHVESAPDEHRETYRALRERDPERAREITERHLVNSADYVIDLLERRRIWEDPEPTQDGR